MLDSKMQTQILSPWQQGRNTNNTKAHKSTIPVLLEYVNFCMQHLEYIQRLLSLFNIFPNSCQTLAQNTSQVWNKSIGVWKELPMSESHRMEKSTVMCQLSTVILTLIGDRTVLIENWSQDTCSPIQGEWYHGHQRSKQRLPCQHWKENTWHYRWL